MFLRIIIKFFLIIFSTSVIAKLIYTYTFYSFLISIFRFLNIDYIFNNIPSKFVVILILSIIIIIEITIIYFSFKKYFNIINLLFLLISLTVIIFSYSSGIDMDCGCFGKIVVIENQLYHIYFLLFLLTLLFISMILKSKHYRKYSLS